MTLTCFLATDSFRCAKCHERVTVRCSSLCSLQRTIGLLMGGPQFIFTFTFMVPPFRRNVITVTATEPIGRHELVIIIRRKSRMWFMFLQLQCLQTSYSRRSYHDWCVPLQQLITSSRLIEQPRLGRRRILPRSMLHLSFMFSSNPRTRLCENE